MQLSAPHHDRFLQNLLHPLDYSPWECAIWRQHGSLPRPADLREMWSKQTSGLAEEALQTRWPEEDSQQQTGQEMLRPAAQSLAEEIRLLLGPKIENPSSTPEELVLSRETERRIWRAFEKLSACQREVFVLHHVDGWSIDEVAEMLGIATGSVKRYLFRAARHLRRILGDRQ